MSEDESDSFKDPALKAAISHAWGAEQAPKTLHNRVLQIVAAERSCPTDQPHAARVYSSTGQGADWPRLLQRRQPWFALAAAALLLLALGIGGYRMLVLPHRTQTTHAISNDLARELVTRHDACCAAADHHMIGLPHDNFIEIGKVVSGQLHIPVVSAPLPGIQWVFNGASICSVGQVRAAHLVFKDGPRDVSVFSLPPAVAQGGSGAPLFETMWDRHPIAGFSRSGVIVCVVGSSQDGSLTLAQTRLLRDALIADSTVEADGASRTTVAGDH